MPFFKRSWKFLLWGYSNVSRTSPFYFLLKISQLIPLLVTSKVLVEMGHGWQADWVTAKIYFHIGTNTWWTNAQNFKKISWFILWGLKVPLFCLIKWLFSRFGCTWLYIIFVQSIPNYLVLMLFIGVSIAKLTQNSANTIGTQITVGFAMFMSIFNKSWLRSWFILAFFFITIYMFLQINVRITNLLKNRLKGPEKHHEWLFEVNTRIWASVYIFVLIWHLCLFIYFTNALFQQISMEYCAEGW